MERSARRGRVFARPGGPGRSVVERVLEGQATERARLAEEVHDEVLQSMIAASIQLELLATRLIDPEAVEIVETARGATMTAIEQLRAILLDLHPAGVPGGGLLETLEEHLRRYDDLGGPAIRLESALGSRPSTQESAVLARIVREAVANAYKHAGARAVTVRLAESPAGLELVVRDDGSGFDVATALSRPGHLGLGSIAARAREAGGTWEIESCPGGGTTLRVLLPRLAA